MATAVLVTGGFAVMVLSAQDDLDTVRQAAEQGDATAQFNLGFMYANGEGVPKDDAEAVRWFRLAAEQGDAAAQLNLGNMYADGQGVFKDDAEAVRWFRLAAEQGLAMAQFNLGIVYDNGEGVLKDDAESIKWYRLAAEQGLANAQLNLGAAYTNGWGFLKDEAEAVKWYRLAADQGLAMAQFNLGITYASGRGVIEDEAEAGNGTGWPPTRVTLMRSTASNMYASGRGHRGRSRSREMVPAGRRPGATSMRSSCSGTCSGGWFRLAAEQGQADAQFFLGVVQHRHGCPPMPKP